jgi:diacylglycerol kinase (ATP)
MICCALFSLIFALPVWLITRLRSKSDPLAWRLNAPGPLQQPRGPLRPGFSIVARIRSFRYAARGLHFLLRSEHNAWLHLAATGAVIGAGLTLEIDTADWRWIAVALLWVWSAEAFNTSIEQICNMVSPKSDERVRIVKDVAAGAVLVSATGAALIGVFTLGPYVARLL